VFWHDDLNWATETARMLKEYDVFWSEEPLRPDNVDGLAH
jgi:L-alanine-DL-glutamate epimerase-like enolase superfamily enzyme